MNPTPETPQPQPAAVGLVAFCMANRLPLDAARKRVRGDAALRAMLLQIGRAWAVPMANALAVLRVLRSEEGAPRA